MEPQDSVVSSAKNVRNVGFGSRVLGCLKNWWVWVLNILGLSITSLLLVLFVLIPYSRPKNIRITNLGSNSVSISWVTDKATPGVVIFGEEDRFLPSLLSRINNDVAYDDRDVEASRIAAVEDLEVGDELDYETLYDLKLTESGRYYVHHVTVVGLDPETKYYFQVGNGVLFRAMETDFAEDEFTVSNSNSFTTFEELDSVPMPDPTYGKVLNEEYAELEDGIAFMKVAPGSDSTPFSSVLNEDGNWYIDISTVRAENGFIIKNFNEDVDNSFVYIESGSEGDSDLMLVPMNEDAPAVDIIVSKDVEESEEIESKDINKTVSQVSASEPGVENVPEDFTYLYSWMSCVAYNSNGDCVNKCKVNKYTYGEGEDVKSTDIYTNECVDYISDGIVGVAPEQEVKVGFSSSSTCEGYSWGDYWPVRVSGGWCPDDDDCPCVCPGGDIVPKGEKCPDYTGDVEVPVGCNGYGNGNFYWPLKDPVGICPETDTCPCICPDGEIVDAGKQCSGNGELVDGVCPASHPYNSGPKSAEAPRDNCIILNDVWCCSEGESDDTDDSDNSLSSYSCPSGYARFSGYFSDHNSGIGCFMYENIWCCPESFSDDSDGVCPASHPYNSGPKSAEAPRDNCIILNDVWCCSEGENDDSDDRNNYLLCPDGSSPKDRSSCTSTLNGIKYSCPSFQGYCGVLSSQHRDLFCIVSSSDIDDCYTSGDSEQDSTDDVCPDSYPYNLGAKSAEAPRDNCIILGDVWCCKASVEDDTEDDTEDDDTVGVCPSAPLSACDVGKYGQYDGCACKKLFGKSGVCSGNKCYVGEESDDSEVLEEIKEPESISSWACYANCNKNLNDPCKNGGTCTQYTTKWGTTLCSCRAIEVIPDSTPDPISSTTTTTVRSTTTTTLGPVPEPAPTPEPVPTPEVEPMPTPDPIPSTTTTTVRSTTTTTIYDRYSDPDRYGGAEPFGISEKSSAIVPDRYGWDLLVNVVNAEDSSAIESFTIGSEGLTFTPEEDGYFTVIIPGVGSVENALIHADCSTVFYIDENGNGEADDNELVDIGQTVDIEVYKETSVFSYDFETGYNFVSFPFINEYIDSYEFLENMNYVDEGLITSIARFRSGQFEITQYREDLDQVYGDRFPIVPGWGYIVRSYGDVRVDITGQEVAAPVGFQFTNPGWHLIGVHGANQVYTAESLLDSIDDAGDLNADNVTKWEVDRAKYEGLQKEVSDSGQMEVYGLDFEINDRWSYFVRISEGSGLWTPD